MNKLKWTLLALLLLVAGCSSCIRVELVETPMPALPTSTPMPTIDVSATVDAAVKATVTAVAQTLVAQTPKAIPTATPMNMVAAPTPITSALPTTKPSPRPKPLAILTTEEGAKIELFSLAIILRPGRWCYLDYGGLSLASGLSVDFNKMKSFEIVEVVEDIAKVKITLLDGTTMTEELERAARRLSGRTELGSFEQGIEKIKQVDFQR